MKVKRLTVTTRDEQVHVFEGDPDEIAAVRYKLKRVRDGKDCACELTNRQGKRVHIYSNTIASIT